MSRIQLLSEVVASQVAAGEVVERPASVIKELVENSLDARARSIEVAIRGGGAGLIRVTDDGIGMDRDDALLCLERHATSKIRSGQDLAAISTLGFRGEAIPSIASVSRFRLATREHDALVGTEVLVTGGRVESVRDAGEAPGTRIEVRSLFYNLPARRKFLRAEATEGGHAEHQLRLLAIGHPAVRFVFWRDERVIFQLPPAARLLDRLRDLWGREMADELLPVEPGIAGAPGGLTRISGFIGKAGVSRASRSDQLVFVNGRVVENSALSQGIREGYHTALMKGRYPLTFLFLELDSAAVDVNVHPAKREVRFRDPGAIRAALVRAVRRTLEAARADWSRSFHQPALPAETAVADWDKSDAADDAPAETRLPLETFGDPPPVNTFVSLEPAAQTPSAWNASSLEPPAANEFPSATADDASASAQIEGSFPAPSEKIAALPPAAHTESAQPDDELVHPGFLAPAAQPVISNPRILGVLGRLYILLESGGGLVLVDQHAAHERILFEELRRRLDAHEVASQRLLPAITVELGPREAVWIREHLDALHRMGIGLEPFGPGGTFKLDSLPPFLRAEHDAPALFREIVDSLRSAGPASGPGAKLRLAEEMIAKTVCRHAVKANDRLRDLEIQRLIADLLACELPYCCPHGRPTMIQISYNDLDKKFRRRV